MHEHRFFVPREWIQGSHVRLEAPLAHQVARVLRLRPGRQIVLLDGSGWAYRVKLGRVSATLVEGKVLARFAPKTEPSVRFVLCQALLKGKHFDWVLQKGTELGVKVFLPLFTRHGVVRGDEDFAKTKLPRWQRIVQEAAEQAGRAVLPEVRPPVEFPLACQVLPEGALALMSCLQEGTVPLREALAVGEKPPREVWIFVGPEGGFAKEEVALAQRRGVHLVSLGPRVLRSETAALAVMAALLYALGEME